MVLSPHAIISQENQGGWSWRPLGWTIARPGMACSECNTGRTKVVGIREQSRSPSCLVLRQLRSRDRDGRQSASLHHADTKQEPCIDSRCISTDCHASTKDYAESAQACSGVGFRLRGDGWEGGLRTAPIHFTGPLPFRYPIGGTQCNGLAVK